MNIDLYKTGEELSSTVLNRPLQQLVNAVNSLQAQLALATGGETLVSKNVPYDQSGGVSVGSLVYTGADGLLRKAKAVWRADADYNGAILPDDSAYVTGIVTSIDAGSGLATVMTKGRIADMSSLVSVFGTNSAPYVGTWMLSDTTPGTVMRETSGRPYLKIPVLTVDSMGGITLTGAVPYAGYHIHKTFTVPSTETWTEDDGVYSYTGAAVSDLTYFNWMDATFTVDGVFDYQGNLSLEEDGVGGVVVLSNTDMNGHTVGISIAVPDSHAEPVVRGIRTIGSGRLTASSLNGLVTIGVDGWDGEEPAPGYRDRAVSRLTDNGGFEMTKVVSRLVGDSSVTVTEGLNGEWAVTTSGGPFMKPVTVSLENTTVTSSGNILYYVFPYSRASAILGTINIPDPPEGWTWNAVPFIDAARSTVTVSASLMFLPNADFDDSVTIPSTAESPSSISVSVAAGTASVTGKADSGWSLSSGGTAWLKLSSDGSSASDMNILSFGLWLEAVQQS